MLISSIIWPRVINKFIIFINIYLVYGGAIKISLSNLKKLYILRKIFIINR